MCINRQSATTKIPLLETLLQPKFNLHTFKKSLSFSYSVSDMLSLYFIFPPLLLGFFSSNLWNQVQKPRWTSGLTGTGFGWKPPFDKLHCPQCLKGERVVANNIKEGWVCMWVHGIGWMKGGANKTGLPPSVWTLGSPESPVLRLLWGDQNQVKPRREMNYQDLKTGWSWGREKKIFFFISHPPHIFPMEENALTE